MVDLGGYVIILVETNDKRVKLYGSPADKADLEVFSKLKLGAQTFILILYFHNDLVEIDPHRLPTRFWRSMGSLCITRLTRK